MERARLNADHRHASLGGVAGIAEDQRGRVGAGDARISGAKVSGERDGVAAPRDGVAGRHDDFEVERNRGTIPRERDAAQLFARTRDARGQRECCRQGQDGSRRDSDEGPDRKRFLKLEAARSRLCVACQGVEQFRSDVGFVAQFDDAEQAFAEFGEVRFEPPGDLERGDFFVPRFQDESPRRDAQECEPRHFQEASRCNRKVERDIEQDDAEAAQQRREHEPTNTARDPHSPEAAGQDGEAVVEGRKMRNEGHDVGLVKWTPLTRKL